MTPPAFGRISPEDAAVLADISAHVEGVAIRNPAGSDLCTLAHAIHNLVLVVERLGGTE